MDFTFEHRFSAEPETIAEVLLDEGYQNSLNGIGSLKQRQLLEQRVLDDGRVRRRIRCVLDVDLPARARQLIGDSDPTWVEVAIWHPDEMRWEWTIEPETAADLLQSFGAIELTDAKSGTLRTVSGQVKVKVPFFGGRVEGWIVDRLRRAYDEEAEALRSHLRSSGHPGA